MKNYRCCRLLEKLVDAFVYYRVPVDGKGQPRGLVFLDLSPSFEKMAGIRKDEIGIGNIITELPAGLARFGFDWFGTYACLKQPGEPFRSEHYSAPLDCWYEVATCKDEQGCLAAVFRDISRRKQLTDRWEEPSCLLTALLDNVPGCLALVIKKYSREIVASNRAARERGATPGQKCYTIVGRRGDCCPFCLAPKLWAGGRIQHLEVEYRGTWYEGVWAPLSEELYVHYIIDINKYKQAEQKIKDYTRKLEDFCYRLKEEMEKVKKMHKKTLLTGLPKIKGCSLAAHYQPARRLGGDFYDVIQVGHKLVLYLSDVSGHGPEGMLLSTFVKEAINSYAHLKPGEIQPEKIIRHLHHQYCRGNYPEDYFICIFLVVFDLLTRELSYTGAGFQASPLVQMGRGRRLQLVSRGLPISNAVPGALMNFTAKQLILEPGTTIFFNTDGLTEQEAGGVYYSTRLPEVFFNKSHLPPENIVQAVNKDFREFNGGRSLGNDDITFVVLQVEK